MLDLPTLAEVLRERRQDLEGTDKYLSGTAMSLRLKEEFGKAARSQAWISLLEMGGADIMTLQPEVRIALLRLYDFTDTELAHLNTRFELRLPLDVNFATTPPAGSRVSVMSIFITGVGTHGGLERVFMPDYIVGKHDPNMVTIVQAANDVLVCDEAKRRLIEGWSLLFDKSMEPREGDTVLYRIKGHNVWILRVWRTGKDEVAVARFDGSRPMIMEPGRPEVEFWGVKFAALDETRDADDS